MTTAVLHCTWSFPSELQLENRCLVAGSRPVHYAFGQSTVPRKLGARNHWQCYQRWLPFQSWAFLTTFAAGQRVPLMPHQERCHYAIHGRAGFQSPLDPESLIIVVRAREFRRCRVCEPRLRGQSAQGRPLLLLPRSHFRQFDHSSRRLESKRPIEHNFPHLWTLRKGATRR